MSIPDSQPCHLRLAYLETTGHFFTVSLTFGLLSGQDVGFQGDRRDSTLAIRVYKPGQLTELGHGRQTSVNTCSEPPLTQQLAWTI